MASLRDQLLKKGLVSAEAHQNAATAARERDLRNELRAAGPAGRARHDLVNCPTASQFKEVAKQLLLADPRLISEVVAVAHQNFAGDKALHALVLQLREAVNRYRDEPDERDRFIRRALRRHDQRYPNEGHGPSGCR